MFDNLPTVPAEDLIYQPGIWHEPSGATAMLPVDFALQYANETYEFVIQWAANDRLFFTDFQAAWAKLTEKGQQLRCPNVNIYVNTPTDFSYSKECAARFGADEASYQATWANIRNDIKIWFDSLPSRCRSIRPAGPGCPRPPMPEPTMPGPPKLLAKPCPLMGQPRQPPRRSLRFWWL